MVDVAVVVMVVVYKVEWLMLRRIVWWVRRVVWWMRRVIWLIWRVLKRWAMRFVIKVRTLPLRSIPHSLLMSHSGVLL